MLNSGNSGTKAKAVSKVQQHFRVLNHIEPENPAYNIPSLIHIQGDLNVIALEKAFMELFTKFDFLRSNFILHDEELERAIRDTSFVFPGLRVIDQPMPFDENNIPEAILKTIHDPFDLENDPLSRVLLVHYPDGSYLLSFVMHHIITDLHFKNVIANELSNSYNQFLSGQKNLSSDSTECLDCNAWYNDWLKGEEAEIMRDKWRQEAKKPNEKLTFPSDYPPGESAKFEGIRKFFHLDTELSEKINLFSKNYALAPFNILLSAWALFLHKIGRQDDFSIGVPFTNRRKAEFKESQGSFVNILPLILNFGKAISCLDLCQLVRSGMLSLHRMQEIPFLEVNKITGQAFQAGFTFEHPLTLNLNNVQSTPVTIERRGSQLDLFLTLWEDKQEFKAYLEYASELFNEQTIEKFIDLFRMILQSMLDKPESSLKDINILPKADLDFILRINETDAEYERNLCIHEKFLQQVNETPDSLALRWGNEQMTYREFNRNTNMLANFLIEEGVKTEDVVAICIDRSPEMMIAIYGIIKAGAAYLPLNIDAPKERQETIVKDANARFILGFSKYSDSLPENIRRVWLDGILQNPLSTVDSEPQITITSRNLAYIIYTSGSTGIPKGVMIEHHSVLNRLGWMQKAYPLGSEDTLLLKTPVSFDVSVWEIFWWGLSGANLVILPEGAQKEPLEILNHIDRFSVSSIHFVPSMFNSFMEITRSLDQYKKLKSLKRIFLSGESLPVQSVNEFNALRKDYNLPEMINLYGPTEATVDVSYYNCPKETGLKKIYIGKAIDNTKLFVVDQNNQLLPLNFPGELIITGVNLARGYMNQPELSNEKFFDVELPGGEVLRAYHTGDQAKLSSNGEIEYLGRMDNQVKIRGLRIELGEIESKILDLPKIAKCIVTADELNRQKTLVAYLVLKKNERLNGTEIKEELRKILPDYMIPSFFIFLDEIPLTTSGKPDRKRLPRAELSGIGENYVPASNNIEKILVGIWKETLGLDNVSVSDNFFDMGGNSLLAISLSQKISKQLERPVSTLNLLEYTTIRDLSQFLTSESDGNLQNRKWENPTDTYRRLGSENLRNRRRMN